MNAETRLRLEVEARAGGFDPPAERIDGTLAVVQWCAANGIPADLVGRWVWVSFDEKPAAAVLAMLKLAGFHWSRERGEWAHNCGHWSGPGKGSPRWKYGSVPVGQAVGMLADEGRAA